MHSDASPPATKYVVGHGPLLQSALAHWADLQPGTVLHAIDVGQDRDYRFDLAALEGIDPRQATAFVAWSAQFLNFRRLELMGELKGRGFRMPALVCRGALVATGVKLGENTMVGAGAVIAPGSQVGMNCHIGVQASVGPGTVIGNSAWLADGVRVGASAQVESHATLGLGVIVEDGITIGRQCILDVAGRRTLSMPAKTFVTTRFPSGVVIVDGEAG